MSQRPRHLHHAFAIIPAVAALLAVTAAVANAGDASAWSDGDFARARLIAGGAKNGSEPKMLRAGIEIVLKPGWKTYWRYPGDSGTPPRISFEGSENVKAVAVLWPAPTRFDDGSGGIAIGYKDDVVFPLQVTRADASKPATLRADVAYAICEKLCVPAEAKLELPLGAASGEESKALALHEARVPRRATLGAAGPLAIAKVERVATPKPHVVVDVVAPAGAKVDLLAEGPNGDWALPLPQPVAGAPTGTRRFAFDLEGVPAGVNPAHATLLFTAIAGSDAIEVAAPLN